MNAMTPAALPYAGDPEADALLASDPMALLIGFVLDPKGLMYNLTLDGSKITKINR